MRNVISFIVLLAFGFIVYTQFSEIAYKFGFAELKKVAVLQNDKKIKVKCDAYAWGFFDEIKIENRFQKCVNDYQAEGYIMITDLSTSAQ
ncbi:hypothetical protein [Cognaticolwellia aestuarii]|uniref:hypothetical protein n=1 Tax=Cognaticolwellia aestuarii TaxID=329993 RepID=UPI000986C026|nr:hypothetical protein [Cognaticolwellia aestuarii]